ncbi:hypothetical protein, partial [Salmonella enterica]|uniref:hypothetical protein n=1 Tax=Salmonella enterica TaxID=28901 RepID=UPI00288CF39E
YQLSTLALQRYLRHRMATYDSDRQFGGVLDLLVRGVDSARPQQGIFTPRPAAAVINHLEDMCAGELSEEAQ